MHILRPLSVILALVGILFIVQIFFIPEDFGIQEQGYMYGWYRQSNVEEWMAFPAKYRGNGSCMACHAEQGEGIISSPHKGISCENCHGPALEHPADPPKLTLDRSRELCLRCHTFLAYPTSQRTTIKGIDPEQHNVGIECSNCHNPHRASPIQ